MIIIYLINLILKLIFNKLYNDITMKDLKFLDIASLESFQYAIYFIDWVLAIFMALALLKYMNVWFKPVNFLMQYLTRFIINFFFYGSFFVILISTATALWIMCIYGPHMYR